MGMDYEKKYKVNEEAVKKIAERVYDNGSTVINRNDLEEMFPALKESEDERVRNKLIDFFKGYSPDEEWWGNITQEDILAWFEKQGEQKSAKNIVEAWKDMRLEVYQQASGNRHEPNFSDDTTKMFSLNDIDEIIEKMSEQKSSEEYNITGIGSKNAQGKLGEMIKKLKPVNEVLEQKPWSEEDEAMLDTVIEDIIKLAGPKVCYHKDVDWLKSIKERVQPKQEWSEEDESHIRYLIECLEHCKKGVALTMSTSTSQEYINWLKSLKPQNSWKPSGAQMKALEYYIEKDIIDKEGVFGKFIFELYAQLKKLK